MKAVRVGAGRWLDRTLIHPLFVVSLVSRGLDANSRHFKRRVLISLFHHPWLDATVW